MVEESKRVRRKTKRKTVTFVALFSSSLSPHITQCALFNIQFKHTKLRIWKHHISEETGTTKQVVKYFSYLFH
jgi:hypothetical protein